MNHSDEMLYLMCVNEENIESFNSMPSNLITPENYTLAQLTIEMHIIRKATPKMVSSKAHPP
jgi:hypothetical protein